MRTDDFDYDLPTGLIAQEPVQPRDSCRLLVLDRASGQIDHRVFTDVARLSGRRRRARGQRDAGPARAPQGRQGRDRRRRRGAAAARALHQRVGVPRQARSAPEAGRQDGVRRRRHERARGRDDRRGRRAARAVHAWRLGRRSFLDIVHRIGEVPLPPYITRTVDDPELYQTVFSRDERSAAAPTAGLHFTPELLERIAAAGVHIETVELDVGIDTFRPGLGRRSRAAPHPHRALPGVRSERRRSSTSAKARGKRVIAVGTTSVRALESAYDADTGRGRGRRGRDIALHPARGTTSASSMPWSRTSTCRARRC